MYVAFPPLNSDLYYEQFRCKHKDNVLSKTGVFSDGKPQCLPVTVLTVAGLENMTPKTKR